MGSDIRPGRATGLTTRREFVAIGAVGLVGGALPGNRAPESPCHFSTTGPASSVPPFELAEVSILELQKGMEAGRWDSHGLTTAYLDRIASLDRQGPTLRHVLETNPEALQIAEGLDRERSNGRIRGPLHGIPMIIKDNVDTADRMTTTAGSLALAGFHAPEDAELVRRLREAGAVVLAKASLSEWANIRSSHSSSGWCSRGGQGKNPYALDRTPCGSSSGTGGGVAASYAAAGIGTETDGSITCPSSAVALVGIKPTVGLVSRFGIIPISATQDTAGPMCRTLEDAAIVLSVIAGTDPRDPATSEADRRRQSDYTRFLDAAGARGRRIGVLRKVFTGYHDGTDRLFEAALEVLRGLGAVLVDPADLPHASDSGAAETEVLLHEFKAGLNDYLAARPSAPVRTLAEVIAFNERERDLVMPFFAQETFLEAEAKGPLTSPAYRKALATCRRLWRTEGIDQVMDRHRLDALVAPTGNPAWPIDLVNGDHFTGSVTTPAAVAGYPHITVPAGDVHGLPVGLSIFGRAWSEPVLISIASAYEQATRHRRPPQFLVTANPGPGESGHLSMETR